MELPERIVVLSHRTLIMKTWMRTRGWLSAYIENVCPFFVGKVVLRSMSFVMTSPAHSTDKGVTSNTSHTAPGSSPASPLSSRSSPPHSQVVTRRTHDFSAASGHSTHCCGVAGRLLAAAAVATVVGAVVVAVVAGAARCATCCFLSLQLVPSPALPARLLWLLATPFDGLSPSASEVHC